MEFLIYCAATYILNYFIMRQVVKWKVRRNEYDDEIAKMTLGFIAVSPLTIYVCIPIFVMEMDPCGVTSLVKRILMVK